jgi:hypothetical protein
VSFYSVRASLQECVLEQLGAIVDPFGSMAIYFSSGNIVLQGQEEPPTGLWRKRRRRFLTIQRILELVSDRRTLSLDVGRPRLKPGLVSCVDR